ncbi:MAG: DUF5994 family protein [Nocardioidaceae bacterium]
MPQIPYPYRHAAPLGRLRLQLAPASRRASVAGVWWPHGRDLTREGPQLVDEFPRGRGRVDRLVYCSRDWEVVAEEVFTSHGRLKVGFLPPEQADGLVLLRLSGSGIVRLRVLWVAPRAHSADERPLSPA